MSESRNIKAEEAGLVPSRIPRHVAAIMDGNGRWAKERGLPRLTGHWEGYKTARTVIEASLDFGVQYLTLYTFSSENWNRPKDEVEGIMRLIIKAAKAELEDLLENDVRVVVSGRFNELPEDVQDQLRTEMELTKDNKRLVLNLAINYGGRAEITDAVRLITEKAVLGEIGTADISENLISQCLYSPDIPDPDMLIRSAGEMRISNFLLWQIAYTEIWVTDVLWPDFGRDDFIRAIADYQKRTRKFGKTAEQVV